MFNSLEGGYFPICVITVVASWFVSKFRRVLIRALFALLIPIAVSLAWYFIPNLFRTQEDPGLVGWGIVTATAWSAAAVPVSIITVVIFAFIRKRSAYRNDCQNSKHDTETDKNP